MILPWLVWTFVAPLVYWLHRVVGGTFAAPLDFDLGVALVLGLFARARALSGLLFAAALGRSVFDTAPLALHFLALGLPVAVLVPLRAVFFRGSIAWQCAAAAFLAFAVPRVELFFGRVTGHDALVDAASAAGGFTVVLWSALCVPPVAWLLRALPPLRFFVEGAQQ